MSLKGQILITWGVSVRNIRPFSSFPDPNSKRRFLNVRNLIIDWLYKNREKTRIFLTGIKPSGGTLDVFCPFCPFWDKSIKINPLSFWDNSCPFWYKKSCTHLWFGPRFWVSSRNDHGVVPLNELASLPKKTAAHTSWSAHTFGSQAAETTTVVICR